MLWCLDGGSGVFEGSCGRCERGFIQNLTKCTSCHLSGKKCDGMREVDDATEVEAHSGAPRLVMPCGVTVMLGRYDHEARSC